MKNVKNVLSNMRISLKDHIKKSKKFIHALAVGFITLLPSAAFAAPQDQVLKVVSGLTSAGLVLAPVIGGCWLIWIGITAYGAQDSHKKAEKYDQMKSIGVITVLIEIAVSLISWIAGLAA